MQCMQAGEVIVLMVFCGCTSGVVVNNVESRKKAELLWQCPAGSYPCNATSAGTVCVERHRWCDYVVDCPNEEDEDPEHCCQYTARCCVARWAKTIRPRSH